MYEKKSVSMKVVVLLLAVVLLIGCVAGGTLAYLMTQTTPVTNTFVAGAIGQLALTETDEDKTYMVVPGVNITKDPVVTFNGNNVAAYVFVKVEADASTWTESEGTFSLGDNQEMKWTVADGWTKLEAGVYYREVAVDTDTANIAEAEKYGIIKDNTITVSSEITQNTIEDYTKSLTFTAYAVQQANGGTENDGKFTPAEAWAQIKTDLNIQ